MAMKVVPPTKDFEQSGDGAGLRPGLDGRGGRHHMSNLPAAYAYVFEAQGSETDGVEQVLGVDDNGVLQQVLDAIEIEGAELGPSSTDDQSVGTFGCGVSGFAITD